MARQNCVDVETRRRMIRTFMWVLQTKGVSTSSKPRTGAKIQGESTTVAYNLQEGIRQQISCLSRSSAWAHGAQEVNLDRRGQQGMKLGSDFLHRWRSHVRLQGSTAGPDLIKEKTVWFGL